MCLLLLLSLIKQLDASSNVLLKQTWMARNLNNILVPDTSKPFMSTTTSPSWNIDLQGLER